MPRLFRNNPSVLSGRCTALCMAVCALVCLSFPALASAARARTVRYLPVSSIDLGVGITYSRVWGDLSEAQAFTQGYDMSVKGYAIDPRLMSFDFDLGLSSEDNSNYSGDDAWAVRTGLKLKFFHGVDRERGLRLWRYVPSPLVLRYDYTVTGDYYFTTYSLSMHYKREGYIRFFSRGKLMYFDDGRKRATTDANRYRLKYQDNTFNYNRNGNGNWNRNGNGNWNRNGNGNWNRNGNGNWNRNGNGNWNRNGNGNFNENGNGMANAGNWESGNGGNASNLRREPSKPLGFRFPHIGLDITRGSWEARSNSGFAYSYTMGNMRIATTDRVTSRDKEGAYFSRYALWHRFYDSGDTDWDSSVFEAKNTWEHFWVLNVVEKSHDKYEDKFEYELDSNYSNTYGKTSYYINLGGLYIKTDTEVSYEYGASIDANTGLTKRIRLTPDLVSTTNLRGSLGRGREKVVDGVRYEGRLLYNVELNEKLEYFRFRRFPVSAELDSGLSESGTPLNFTLKGETRGFRRWRFMTNYRYYRRYPSAYGESLIYQSLNVDIAYTFNSHFSTRHSLQHSEQIEAPGEKDGSTSLSYTGGFNWRVSSVSNLDVQFNHGRTSLSRSYGYLVRYRTQTSYRGDISIALQSNWDNITEGKDDKLFARYNWNYRQFVMALEYDYAKNKLGTASNELWIKLSRKFSLRARRLNR